MPGEIVFYKLAGRNWAVANLVMEFCRQFYFSCRFGLRIDYELLKDDMLKIKITLVQESIYLEFYTTSVDKKRVGLWPLSGTLYLNLEKAGKEFCGFKSRQASFRVERERQNGNFRFISEDYDGKCCCFESTPLFIPK